MPKKKYKPFRDRFGRFAKRGSKLKPPQRRDKRGRYLHAKRRPKPKPKRKRKLPVPKKYLSPKHRPKPEALRFRPIDYEGDEDLGGDDLEDEMEWQDQFEDDFSALDAMDDLDDLSWTDDEEHYHEG